MKGAAGVAAGAAIGGVSKRSSFAAPAVIQSGPVDVLYWGSFSDVLGEAEQEMVRRFNESQDEVIVEYQFQGSYEETAQKLTAAMAAVSFWAVSS